MAIRPVTGQISTLITDRLLQKFNSTNHLQERIHRRQHATDDAGMSKHTLSPYYAYYHN